MPKKIVYLLGSGATQGAIRKIDEEKSLLTRDIQKYIREKRQEQMGPSVDVSDKIWNEIITDGRDIEHIISMLDCQYKYATANTIREYYHEAIVHIVASIGVETPPNLYTVLADLHLRSALRSQETVLCYMSLNYEDLFERSIRSHLNTNADYVVETVGSDAVIYQDSLPVLKLHGSFNWSNKRPIEIADMTKLPCSDTLWIPPGVDKKKEHYPFNLLWGKAVEFISQCDTLRIIGCSLSRNDWGLIPILYTAQTLGDRNSLSIEVIDYAEAADRISATYGYLSVSSILDLDEIGRYYTSNYHGIDYNDFKTYFSEGSEARVNCFEKWLDAKIEDSHTVDEVIRNDLIEKSEATFVARYYNKSL